MKEYDVDEVDIIVFGKKLTGAADGTKVKVGRNARTFTLKVGSGGEGTRSKSNDKSGYIEVSLMASSDDNAFLTGIMLADEVANAGVVPVLVKDKSGADLHQASNAFIEGPPDAEYATEVGTRTWRFLTDDLDMALNGNNAVTPYSG